MSGAPLTNDTAIAETATNVVKSMMLIYMQNSVDGAKHQCNIYSVCTFLYHSTPAYAQLCNLAHHPRPSATHTNKKNHTYPSHALPALSSNLNAPPQPAAITMHASPNTFHSSLHLRTISQPPCPYSEDPIARAAQVPEMIFQVLHVEDGTGQA